MANGPVDNPAAEYDFDLRSVSWGYRPIFAKRIAHLLAAGDIGPDRRGVTAVFFDMLRRSRPGSFDFALKEFLVALNPRTKWLLELPGMFEDFCTLGRELTESKLAYGIAFFRLWGQGGFGDDPEHVRGLIRHVRFLRTIDAELAQAFLSGYRRLIELLDAPQTGLFVNHLRAIHRQNPRTASDFAALRLKSALAFVRDLTAEARLEDLRDRLGRLARALGGRTVAVGDLSGLDSDSVIDRNCTVVCFQDHLYLPARIRCCPTRGENEALYVLATVVAAEALRRRSFPAIQGDAGKADLPEWLGDDEARCALVAILEMTRIVQGLRERMPGARRLVDLGLRWEFDLHPPRTGTDALLRRCLSAGAGPNYRFISDILAAARAGEDCFDSARRADDLLEDFRRLADAPPRALSFFPDLYYPAGIQPAPAGALVADLSRSPLPRPAAPEDRDQAAPARRAGRSADEDDAAVPAAFVYPEWNQNENDYYQDWCFLREHRPKPDPHFHDFGDEEQDRAVRKARKMFERLKPELARKEKYLSHGDEIDIDLLVEFMALKRRMPSPPVRFYRKTFIKKRDLAAALLLDVSGSTAGLPGDADPSGAPPPPGPGRVRILDLEKRAALTLAAGLEALGDAFGVYGFSGNGREHCDFYVYKDLEEPFDADARHRLLSANPVASTRIGVALRHCREKLTVSPARRKLVLLITDGKPQDTGYDPATRYAQYDVRMACQECARQDIHVVCISTLENSRADLEIMFPHRRYVILEDMHRLADVLPGLYLKITD